ncbi:hypothetical protein DEO72_LG11g2273 [Vigna unguiculata]|uniref:Secreted protein n=1 Tax=Vigna unguiculata TaxID=3917 RepID=A0A4D6NRG2_VIGUN|nr:hypothetical protein DEO72_LG11g2273 [Vigna unguiculata]
MMLTQTCPFVVLPLRTSLLVVLLYGSNTRDSPATYLPERLSRLSKMTCGPKQGSPPERDARAEPHNPHDFLLRRDSLA